MLEFNKKSNTLEQTEYLYSLQDVPDPHLYRYLFNYEEVPKVPFNHRHVPMRPPEHLWITDSTFRDGQQAREPYTVKQIVDIFTFLHRLSGPNGIIRQSEFFLYSKKDQEAVVKCMELGYDFPEITGWIRAVKEDFYLVKEMGLKETGILASCSDYHIFNKLKMNRRQAMEQFLSVVKSALEIGVIPRVHLEDITRADFYGFVVPFALELMKLQAETKIPIKIRACDTLGFGVNYPGVALPRSVPGIIYGLWHHAGVSSEQLEWHGHNDFYKAVSNAGTAWLYGCSGVNTTLLGIGERTGNCPLEAMVFEYASLKGSLHGMDTTVITEIADYFIKEIGYSIPPMTPLVGREFNFTRSGIHADGLLKDEEIYNIFNTEKLLNRKVVVAVNERSGAAGIAHWINSYFSLKQEQRLEKRDPRLVMIKNWVDKLYVEGRDTVIGDHEIIEFIQAEIPELWKTLNQV